jgi:hypothetical protein
MSKKIKIDKPLYERIEMAAQAAGYASTDEFIVHVLERETKKLEETAADGEVEKQLRGLGYIE